MCHVCAVMMEHVSLGVSVSVERKQYEARRKVSRHHRKERRTSYTYGFTVLYNRLLGDTDSWNDDSLVQLRNTFRCEALAFILEEGAENNAEAENSFQEMKRKKKSAKCFGDLSFQSKTDSRAIQVADFLAHYSHRAVVFGGMDPIHEMIVNQVPHTHFVVTDAFD